MPTKGLLHLLMVHSHLILSQCWHSHLILSQHNWLKMKVYIQHRPFISGMPTLEPYHTLSSSFKYWWDVYSCYSTEKRCKGGKKSKSRNFTLWKPILFKVSLLYTYYCCRCEKLNYQQYTFVVKFHWSYQFDGTYLHMIEFVIIGWFVRGQIWWL